MESKPVVLTVIPTKVEALLIVAVMGVTATTTETVWVSGPLDPVTATV
jgi:hypothetical protein